MNHRGCVDGTGGTQRMAQRNRAAHRVDGREELRRERFVDFAQVIRKLARLLREAEIANVPFLGALAGCSARRSERRVASHTSEKQRRNAPGSAAKNGILAFSASLSLERLHVRLLGKLVLCLARDLPLPRHRVFSMLAAV